MGDQTGIEWTDATWNPVVGCSLETPGCTNCYAMKMAGRLEAMAVAEEAKTGDPGPMQHYMGTTQMTKAGAVWTGVVNVAPDSIFLKPLRWTRPRKIFVNSMSDLFHPAVLNETRDRAFAVMALTPRHIFQLLTKRADIQRAYLSDRTLPVRIIALVQEFYEDGIIDRKTFERFAMPWPLPNVWAGVSVEDQTRAELRLVDLGNTPAAVRWVSAEPLIGELDFRNVKVSDWIWLDALTGYWTGQFSEGQPIQLPASLEPIDWIVAGGESGPGSRPMHPLWPRSIRDQTSLTGTSFLFKQHGNWIEVSEEKHHADYSAACRNEGPWPFDKVMQRDGLILPGDAMFIGDRRYVRDVGKKKAGRLLDGRTHDGYPG